MSRTKKAERDNSPEAQANHFRRMLERYLSIKGLDIVVMLDDGTEIELSKNRKLIDDVIIYFEQNKYEKQIPISKIKSVDCFAA